VSDVLAAQIEKAEQMRGLYMSEQKKSPLVEVGKMVVCSVEVTPPALPQRLMHVISGFSETVQPHKKYST
jgi:hypothetical protein